MQRIFIEIDNEYPLICNHQASGENKAARLLVTFLDDDRDSLKFFIEEKYKLENWRSHEHKCLEIDLEDQCSLTQIQKLTQSNEFIAEVVDTLKAEDIEWRSGPNKLYFPICIGMEKYKKIVSVDYKTAPTLLLNDIDLLPVNFDYIQCIKIYEDEGEDGVQNYVESFFPHLVNGADYDVCRGAVVIAVMSNDSPQTLLQAKPKLLTRLLEDKIDFDLAFDEAQELLEILDDFKNQ